MAAGPVTVTVRIGVTPGGAPLPGSTVLANVVIRSGRTRADDGLGAASATVGLIGSAHIQIADPMVIQVNGAARFTGRVAEITWSPLGDSSDAAYTVVGVGNIAYLGRVSIPLPLAAQNASDRAVAVLTAAGIPATVAGGNYALAAYGLVGDPPAGADEVLSQLMTDTGAIVADVGDGSILVQFPDGRSTALRWTPDAAATSDDLSWTQTDELVNDVAVEYVGGVATASSGPSIAQYGLHSSRITTQLASSAPAIRRASGIAARLSTPAWAIAGLETWDNAFLTQVVGTIVRVTPLPASAPMASDGEYDGALEGWTETYLPARDVIGAVDGTYQLALGDLQTSGLTIVWANVTAATTWANTNPATAWDEAILQSDLH